MAATLAACHGAGQFIESLELMGKISPAAVRNCCSSPDKRDAVPSAQGYLGAPAFLMSMAGARQTTRAVQRLFESDPEQGIT